MTEINSYDNELNNFLIKQKELFLVDLNNKNELKNWCICIGNEAGDLDSLASSISTAYLLTKSSSSTTNLKFISLIQTNSNDLYLRPENLLSLSSSFIKQTSLLFISDLTEIKENLKNCSFFLVDQNKLLPLYGKEPKVIGILDHHVDENLPYTLLASPRIIKPFIVGSCSSLILNYFISILPYTPTNYPKNLIDLLLSALLIDTSLKSISNGGKAGEDDDLAAQFLIPHSSFSSPSISTSPSTTSALIKPTGSLATHLEELTLSKFNLTNMSGKDLLRRDYKEYSDNSFSYGLSTVPVGFSEWLLKVRDSGEGEEVTGWKAIEKDLEEWVKERGLDMIGVLTSYTSAPSTTPLEVGKKPKKSITQILKKLTETKSEKESRKSLAKIELKKSLKPTHEREILLYTTNPLLFPIYSNIEKVKEIDLINWKGNNSSLPSLENRNFRIWNQNNSKATRKQVAPVLKSLICGIIRK